MQDKYCNDSISYYTGNSICLKLHGEALLGQELHPFGKKVVDPTQIMFELTQGLDSNFFHIYMSVHCIMYVCMHFCMCIESIDFITDFPRLSASLHLLIFYSSIIAKT